MNLFLLLTASLRWASPEINHAPLLFTIARDCSQWKYRGAWKAHGYNPVCVRDNRLKQLVWTHCRRVPIRMIQYADVGRHLLLYERGGWYVDSDVRPTPRCQTLKTFPNTTFGLESDFTTSGERSRHYWMLPRSLCLWAIYGIAGDPVLRNVACALAAAAEDPMRSTENVRDYIFRTTGPTAVAKLWASRPTQPVSVFGCGQPHSRSPPCSAASCWGCHTFQNSWL